MNALELAALYLWDAEDGQYYDSAIADKILPMLRQQQAEIKRLTQENHDLWKQLNDGKGQDK